MDTQGGRETAGFLVFLLFGAPRVNGGMVFVGYSRTSVTVPRLARSRAVRRLDWARDWDSSLRRRLCDASAVRQRSHGRPLSARLESTLVKVLDSAIRGSDVCLVDCLTESGRRWRSSLSAMKKNGLPARQCSD